MCVKLTLFLVYSPPTIISNKKIEMKLIHKI